MRILVACEFSGAVRDALRARGHNAISCDLLPSETPGPHIQGDVMPQLVYMWDMIIAFPPCTHLAKSGNRHFAEKQADGRQQRAMEFFLALYNAPAPRIVVENPVGIMNRVFRKPDQIIQPWQHGDPWKKETCLWLRGLPPLEPSNPVEPQGSWVGGGKMGAGQARGRHRDPRVRSKTFPGIAKAMAEQWG